MALTEKQRELILRLDKQAKQILPNGGEEALLMFLVDNIQELKSIIYFPDKSELDTYCQQYDGFYQCMKLLERWALAISNGSIKV